MYTKSGDHRVEIREEARGGEGKVAIHHLLEKEQLAPHSRLLCKAVIEPGNILGYHTHVDEGEFFYVLSGVAKIIKEDKETLLYPGDTFWTPAGCSHSIEAAGDETLEYLAIVLATV